MFSLRFGLVTRFSLKTKNIIRLTFFLQAEPFDPTRKKEKTPNFYPLYAPTLSIRKASPKPPKTSICREKCTLRLAVSLCYSQKRVKPTSQSPHMLAPREDIQTVNPHLTRLQHYSTVNTEQKTRTQPIMLIVLQ